MARTVRLRPRSLKVIFEILPQEILDLTIDHLEDDVDSLKAVSLVGRAWYHRTREHLFREITIGGAEADILCIQLKEFLEKKPMLRQCIKGLTLSSMDQSYQKLVSIVDIIPLLSSVTSVAVGGTFDLPWDLLAPGVIIALYELIANPRISKISFTNVSNLDVVPFSQFHHLRELVLTNVYFDDHEPSEIGASFPLNSRWSLPRLPTPNDYIRVLDITGSGWALKTLLACAESSEGTLNMFQPTYLLVGTQDWDDWMKHAWGTVLSRCSGSVERYDVLHPPDETFIPKDIFDFSRFPKLKDINITTTHQYVYSESLPVILKGFDQLSQSNTPRQLEKIRLEFDFRALEDTGIDHVIARPIKLFAKKDFWSKFDAILAKPAFPRLAVVLISFDVTYCRLGKQTWNAVKGDILSRMPNLARIVKVTHTRQPPDTGVIHT